MLWNSLFLALREIRRNLFRSFLTVLGVVIGVAAVITMVTLGNGATAKVTEDISKLGNNMLILRPGQRRGPGGSADAKPFTLRDLAAIREGMSDLQAVAPASSTGVTAVVDNRSWSTSATGTDNEFFTVRGWDLSQGREFTEGELRSGRAVCVLGMTPVQALFGAMDPIGKRIRVQGISCEIIGVLEAKGQTGPGHDQDDLIVMPLRAYQRRIAGNLDLTQIQMSVAEGASSEAVQKEIELLMRERRRISPGKPDDFSVRSMEEIARTLTGTTQVLTALLGAIAAVSLLVGGIGIMNIMLVSVTERTREIGTRLAIGALRKDVLLQFLVESTVLSALGGVFGIVLAIALSLSLSRYLQVPFLLDVGIVLIAFFFSAAVGILFGFFPARRAASLNPIEALRHE